MKVFIAILSALCMGAMMTETDRHNKLMWCVCFITTIIAILMLILLPMKVL